MSLNEDRRLLAARPHRGCCSSLRQRRLCLRSWLQQARLPLPMRLVALPSSPAPSCWRSAPPKTMIVWPSRSPFPNAATVSCAPWSPACPIPVVALDRDGRVLALNERARALAPSLRRGEPALITLRMPELVDAIRRATASRTAGATGRVLRACSALIAGSKPL